MALNVNRVRHLENAMVHFERAIATENGPRISIDSHLRSYHAAHRNGLSLEDKEWLSDKFKDIYRWKSLLDNFSKDQSTPSVGERLRTYFVSEGWRSYTNSKRLPEHIRLSIPEELFNTLSKQYGKEKSRKIASTYNEKPATFLRVNRLVESRDTIIKNLSSKGITAEPTMTSEIGIKISRNPKLLQAPELVVDRSIELQDESCQIIGSQVDIPQNHKGTLVLDYCAGSGGKSLVFGPDMGGKGHLYVHDINHRYLIQARNKLRSAKIGNFTLLNNSTESGSEKMKNLCHKKMDWIIVDAPSTGSGQYRRYPDRKWLYSDKFLSQCVERQREIFKSALKFLKPKKGKILYSVSSILSAETWDQLTYFCDTHGLYLCYEPVHSVPVSHGMDGFFCATLEKK